MVVKCSVESKIEAFNGYHYTNRIKKSTEYQ